MQRKNEARWIESRQRWQINVQAEGERRTFTSSKPGTKGKVEAEKKADKWLDTRLINETTKVSALLDQYISDLQKTTSASHWRQYDSHIRLYIKPVIGAKRIGRLTKRDLQDVLDDAYFRSSRFPEKKLSEKSLKNIRSCMMNFLSYCRERSVTALYPEHLKIPSGAKPPEKTILYPSELDTLFSTTTTMYHMKRREDPYIHAYRFEVLTGLRVGELVGLQRGDISGSRMTIARSINDDGEETRGKNKNARRSQELGELALNELNAQFEMLKALGGVSKWVFPDVRDMGFLNQELYRKSWARYCDANGIDHARTPYELRHTFCSINDEMPEGLKKTVMGHSRSMDTEGVYGHERTDALHRAAGYVDAAFKDALKTDKTGT